MKSFYSLMIRSLAFGKSVPLDSELHQYFSVFLLPFLRWNRVGAGVEYFSSPDWLGSNKSPAG